MSCDRCRIPLVSRDNVDQDSATKAAMFRYAVVLQMLYEIN